MKYKRIRLNPQIRATMFIGFQRKLFGVPKENDVFYVAEPNRDCTFYFEIVFWESYVSQLQDAYELGKFSSSNANADWMNLYQAIMSAKDSDLPLDCRNYYSEIKMFL